MFYHAFNYIAAVTLQIEWFTRKQGALSHAQLNIQHEVNKNKKEQTQKRKKARLK